MAEPAGLAMIGKDEIAGRLRRQRGGRDALELARVLGTVKASSALVVTADRRRPCPVLVAPRPGVET
jgi:hypothetical protein